MISCTQLNFLYFGIEVILFIFHNFGKYDRRRKVLKCGAGGGWRRSVGPIM
jgi:hypothetical protein